jgi:hypothetical protein
VKEWDDAFSEGENFGRRESARAIKRLTRENEQLRAALQKAVVARPAERFAARGVTNPGVEQVADLALSRRTRRSKAAR